MPYQIQNVENGSYVIGDHNPASFPDGAQAAAFLKTLKDKGDKRPLKIIPINDPAADRIWQERERQRMADGTYVAPPFQRINPLSVPPIRAIDSSCRYSDIVSLSAPGWELIPLRLNHERANSYGNHPRPRQESHCYR